MWEYNYSDNNQLMHTGIKGMHWGHRKNKAISGNKVYQRKMTAHERDIYAKNRIKKVGARQAINDENDKTQRSITIKSGAMAVGHVGLFATTTLSAVTGLYPLAIASGAAFVANMIGTPMSIQNDSKNNSRNIEAIKRKANMPDITTGYRSNTKS